MSCFVVVFLIGKAMTLAFPNKLQLGIKRKIFSKMLPHLITSFFFLNKFVDVCVKTLLSTLIFEFQDYK